MHVATYPRRAPRSEITDKLEPLAVGLSQHKIESGFGLEPEIERHTFQVQFSRLDLREVKDVVDEAQQRVAAVLNRSDHCPLMLVQLGVRQQVCHADDCMQGVRISWLIMAKQGDFVSAAARAASRSTV